MSQSNLTEDLNIVANSNLEITYMDGDLNIIQALDDEPNDVGGLTSAELKAKFDEGPNKIKEYINGTLIPEILTEEATEAARAAAEAQREANEKQRIENENARIAAEQDRVSETTGIVAQATEQAEAAEESARQAAQAILGQIVDGSMTEEKLAAEVQAAINRAKAGGEIDTLLAGKAPAGYGLGKTAYSTKAGTLADIDTYVENGWWRFDTVGVYDAIGVIANHSVLRIDAGRTIVQTLFLSSYDAVVTRRKIATESAWGEWEWVNPPMAVGVEYRTTERYDGKVVTRKLVNCGAIANGKTVQLADNSKYRIISANVRQGSAPIPYWHNGNIGTGGSTNVWNAYFSFGGASITLYCGDSAANAAQTVLAEVRLIPA